MMGTHVRPARLGDLPGVAAVVQDAFSEKMCAIFGDHPEKIAIILEAAYTGPVQRGYDGLLVAERAGRIVGSLLLEPMYYTPAENRMFEHIAVRELGMPRMLRAALLLWLIGHTPDDDEAYISDLGVAGDCRGEGIGRLLLDGAEQWAQSHQRQRLTLYVAESNTGAQKLYEKSGFVTTRTRSSRMTGFAFGIRHWHFMEKEIPATDTDTDTDTHPAGHALTTR